MAPTAQYLNVIKQRKAKETPMSFFSKIDPALHSTVAWIEKELTTLEGEAPTIERVIDAGLAYIGPVLTIALDAVGEPAVATVVQGVFTKAQNALTAASALVTDFGPTPTAASIFTAVQSDLSSLLAAGDVKSTVTIAAITKAVSEVGLLGQAIGTAYSAISAAPTTAQAAAVKA